MNPTLYKFEGPEITPAEEQKHVAVVGAGPAGCEAALTLAKRGHKVTIFEKRDFGGTMIEASVPDNKANIRRLIQYYKKHVEANDAITIVREEADFDKIANGGFDAVILAAGGKARVLKVEEDGKNTIIYANDYLNGSKKAIGNKVAVIGGGITGAETALELKNEGKDVTIVEMADRFLASNSSACQAYSISIAQTDIRILTGKRLVAAKNGKAVLVDRWGNTTELEADSIVIAAGYVPQHELAERLEDETDLEVYNAGDSKQVRQIYDAIHEGFIAARQI